MMGNKPENIQNEIERLREQQELKNRVRRRRRRRRLVKRVLAGLLLVCLITAGILFLYFPLVRKDFRFLPFLRPENKAEPAVMEALEDPENALCFIFVNVGEGDCTIVYEPKTQSALIIDAGYWNYATHVTEQVKRFGEVREVQMIVTHPHADHMGGLTEILKKKMLPVTQVYYSAPTAGENAFAELKEEAEQQKLAIRALAAGDNFTFGGAQINIVSPKDEPYEDMNNASLAVLIVHEGHKILIAGDMEREAESTLCESAYASLIRDVDILRLGHHGSNSSTTYRLLDLTYPGIAVISVGAGNPYGHPDADVLARLNDLASVRNDGCEILRTDRDGDITFISEPAGLKRLK